LPIYHFFLLPENLSSAVEFPLFYEFYEQVSTTTTRISSSFLPTHLFPAHQRVLVRRPVDGHQHGGVVEANGRVFIIIVIRLLLVLWKTEYTNITYIFSMILPDAKYHLCLLLLLQVVLEGVVPDRPLHLDQLARRRPIGDWDGRAGRVGHCPVEEVVPCAGEKLTKQKKVTISERIFRKPEYRTRIDSR
jgi:hypothetical protein